MFNRYQVITTIENMNKAIELGIIQQLATYNPTSNEMLIRINEPQELDCSALITAKEYESGTVTLFLKMETVEKFYRSVIHSPKNKVEDLIVLREEGFDLLQELIQLVREANIVSPLPQPFFEEVMVDFGNSLIKIQQLTEQIDQHK